MSMSIGVKPNLKITCTLNGVATLIRIRPHCDSLSKFVEISHTILTASTRVEKELSRLLMRFRVDVDVGEDCSFHIRTSVFRRDRPFDLTFVRLENMRYSCVLLIAMLLRSAHNAISRSGEMLHAF
jgi:hypothetical protein